MLVVAATGDRTGMMRPRSENTAHETATAKASSRAALHGERVPAPHLGSRRGQPACSGPLTEKPSTGIAETAISDLVPRTSSARAGFFGEK